MSMYGDGPRTVVVIPEGDDRTVQSAKDECDINNILRRYAKSGMLTHVAKGRPAYLDVSEVGDYRAVVERVRNAERFFEGLPSKVRARFENDVATYLDQAGSLTDAELVELGLKVLEKPKGGAAEDVPKA